MIPVDLLLAQCDICTTEVSQLDIPCIGKATNSDLRLSMMTLPYDYGLSTHLTTASFLDCCRTLTLLK